jgi:pimeloyl-ACP methyl ester carboxylesterase
MAFWHPALIQELAAERFLLMYDQRGHGRSDMPASGYTSSELARDATAVLDAYGAEQTDVVARSFGSTVALQLARLFPARVRSLVLLDARLRLFQPVLKLGEWPDFERWRASLGAAGDRLEPGLDLGFMLPLYLAATGLREASRDLAANGFAPMSGGRRGAARYRRLIEETTARADYQQADGLDLSALRALSCRMLAFLENYATLHRELPGSDSRIVDGGGHNSHVVFPEHTARLASHALGRREAARARAGGGCESARARVLARPRAWAGVSRAAESVPVGPRAAGTRMGAPHAA